MPLLETEFKSLLDKTFIPTVNDVFLSICAIDLQLVNSYEEPNSETPADLTSTISMTAEDNSLSLALSMDYDTANLIISNMIGIGKDEVSTQDLMDGISETLNILSGSAKSMLSALDGRKYSLSLPMVITGKGHQVFHQKVSDNQRVVVYEFSDDENPVYLKVVYGQNKNDSV